MNRLQSALLHAAPVAATAVYGAWWIASHAGGGRASAHAFWQSLALAETLLALLLRDRKPATALVGILAAYLLLALDPLLLPGVLVALCTGTMPCDGPRPKEKTGVFARWIDAGKHA